MSVATAPVPTSAFARTAAVTAWQARSFRRTWRATITTAFLNPIFFLLAMGVLLGKLVDDPDGALGGLSYVDFVAPGLLAAVAMQVGTGEGSYTVMAGIKWFRTYHAVMATPVRVAELVLGTLSWATMRILVSAIIFTAVATAAGAFESPTLVLAPLAALLTGLAFFAPISLVAVSVDDDFWFAFINRFAIIPMFLFSGTFFPVSQLPDALEPVAWATPLWHGVTLCRDLTTGSLEALPAVGHMAFLLAIVIGATAASVRMHSRRLQP